MGKASKDPGINAANAERMPEEYCWAQERTGVGLSMIWTAWSWNITGQLQLGEEGSAHHGSLCEFFFQLFNIFSENRKQGH